MNGFHKIGLLSLFTLSTFTFAAPPANHAIGQMVWVKGQVKANAPGGPPRILARRSPLFKQDTITTDAVSSGQIVFTDNSLVSINANTSVVLSQYQYGKGTSPHKSSFVADLAKGGFRTITGAVVKDNADGYQVKTPVATIGVAGTGFFFHYDPTTKKLSMDCEIGTCHVSNEFGRTILDNNSRYAIVNIGKAPIVTPARPAELGAPPTLQSAAFDPNATPTASKTNDSDQTGMSVGGASSDGGGGGTSSGGGGVKELKALNMPCP